MSTQLKLECYRAAGSMREARELYEWLTTEAPAIAALEPAPAELEAEPVAPDVEIPEGFTKWEGGEWRGDPQTVVAVKFRSGMIPENRYVAADWNNCWLHTATEHARDIIAYRIISQPADQSEALGQAGVEVETQPYHERNAIPDDLRTAEAETVSGDDRTETQSVLDDPELIETAERLEATLAAAEPNYVGLQDPELDADWDAMKEREKADKPKLHFSIFGERGNRKLEEV